MVRRISSSIFVGRVGERALLASALDAAEQGEPGLVLLGGEAGIGKTRLVTELATIGGTRGDLVVRGHCLEANAAGLPFAPFIEILRQLLLREDGRGGVGTVDLGSAELARLVPEIDPNRAPDRRPASGEDRLRLFYAVAELFGRTAKDRPLVLVVEDLHWADPSSVDLLRFLAGALAAERLLILSTFRTDELHRRHPLLPLLSELVRLPHIVRLDLAAFTEAEVADQLTGITGLRPADDLVQRIFARTDGNPFFVEELAGRSAGPLPATLHHVLAARMATLSPPTRTLVLAAAAIGREASHRLLAKVSELREEQLLKSLREATEHHVLVSSGDAPALGFAFRHALIQELAYGEILPTERMALHKAIVTSLRKLGGSSG